VGAAQPDAATFDPPADLRSCIMFKPRVLRSTALVLCVTLALPVPAGAADTSTGATGKASREESTGVASGLVIGAAAGGPFGAIVGAATGAWFGDRFHAQRRAAMAAGNLTHQFGFRTDSSTLEPDAVEALRQIAELAQRLPGTRMRIVGGADPRGEAQYNLTLSQRRAAAVAEVLVEAGVDPARLDVQGLGAMADATVTPDPDGWAFARRVTVTLAPAGATPT
jgi:outer membrane protein OmpA-like peptidoglycan-associated protein